MSMKNTALWLGGRKIYAAKDISGALDAASLCGYFRGGKLAAWLRENGGEEYAERLEGISPDDPQLFDKMKQLFGGTPLEYKELGGSAALPRFSGYGPANASSRAAGDFSSYFSSFGVSSFKSISNLSTSYRLTRFASSFGFTSGFSAINSANFALTSAGSYVFSSRLLRLGFWRKFAGFGSFSSYSGALGSYLFGYEWEWEWENFFREFGSFYAGSFAFASFLSAFAAFFSAKGGSFSVSSLNFSSFFRSLFGSFTFGSFRLGSFNFGSFKYEDFGLDLSQSGSQMFSPDEFDRIMLECVFGCPLNAFGYGIHNI